MAAVAQTRGKIAEIALKIIQIDQDLSSEVAKEMREIAAQLEGVLMAGGGGRVVAGRLQKHTEIVQALGHVRMHRAERLLAEGQRLSGLEKTFPIVAVADMLNDLCVQSTSSHQRILRHLGGAATKRSGRRHHRER